MTLDVTLASLIGAVLLTPMVLYIGYYIIVPWAMITGYKKGMSSTTFSHVDGSEGAGSIDIDYYTLYYDVRNQDVLINGTAPSSRHWQIGAFDGMARVIDGAYVNHKTATLDDAGNFQVRLTAHPTPEKAEDLLDCSASKRGMVIFRIVLPLDGTTTQLPVVRFSPLKPGRFK